MPHSLASAMGRNYKAPRNNMTEGLLQGFQIGEQAKARKAQAELAAQQRQEKQDERFGKILESIKVEAHPWNQSWAERDAAETISQAIDSREKAGGRYNYETSKILVEGKNKQAAHKGRIKSYRDFETVPAALQDDDYTAIRNSIAIQGKNNIENVKGSINPLTGNGISEEGVIIYSPYQKVRHQEVFAKDMQAYDMEYQGAMALGQGDRFLLQKPKKEAATFVATELFKDPNIYRTYFNENAEYVAKKYGKNEEMLKQGPLVNNPIVQADLQAMFVAEKLASAGLMGKKTKDGSSQGSQANKNLVAPVENQTTIPVNVKNTAGGVSVREVGMPYYEAIGLDNTGFGKVGMVSMATGKQAEGTGQIIGKTGGIGVIPIYKRGTKGRNKITGNQEDLSGQTIGEDDLANMTPAQLAAVEYATALVVAAEEDTYYKPVSGPGDLSGLPKFDQANAKAKFDFAEKKKAKLNAELKEKSKPTSPAKTSYTNKQSSALAAFEKQVGRKPTDAELKKILAKYK